MKKLFLGMSLLLAACSPINESNQVVGPDMDKAGPFSEFSHIILTPSNDGSDMRIDIRKGAGEDIATLHGVLSGTKSYLAGVTYRAFTPVIAETNADRRDYWIVGLNLTRTPDRSVYSILRFPHGQSLKPGAQGEADYLQLGCSDLEVARAQIAAYDPANSEKELKPEIVPEAGHCEFDSLDEAYRLTPLILRKYDQIKHFENAPKPDWQPLRIEIN